MQLALAQVEHPEFATGWNFGPDRADERPVAAVAEAVVAALGNGRVDRDPAAADLHEAKMLRLDVSQGAGRTRLAPGPVVRGYALP